MIAATRENCIRYINATDEDVNSPDWDDILYSCEPLVVRAFMMTSHYDDFIDDYPTPEKLMHSAVVSDWLIYADDKMKRDVIVNLEV